MISKTIKIIIVFILPQIILAQETFVPSDSSIRFKGIVRPIYIDYELDELFVPFASENNDLSYDNQSTIWLRTNLALSTNMFSQDEDYHQHFLLPLYNQYLEDSKFDPVRYALGMAQLSAVSYLAYRHVKKYGFIK